MSRPRIVIAISVGALGALLTACATTPMKSPAPCSRYHHSTRGGAARTYCGVVSPTPSPARYLDGSSP